MKKLVVGVLIVVFAALNGCAMMQQRKTEGIQKTFFNRTIVYAVDSDAQEDMKKLEKLLTHVYEKAGVKELSSDDVILPIYRDADTNRDHRISSAEAKNFYNEYIIQFEDSLGSVRYKPEESEK